MFDAYIGMDPASSHSQEIRGRDAQITVFPTRDRFETGVSRMLKTEGGECAVLHMTVRSDTVCTGALSRKVLNLAGNALRAEMHAGAVVYLGDAEYAVFLQDTDAREAAAYAQAVTALVSGFKLQWEDEELSFKACIGGVLADDCQDGVALLELAEATRAMAWGKPGCKVHMTHAAVEYPQLAANKPGDRIYSAASL